MGENEIIQSGGILFGPVMGTFYNLTSATIGAIISFAIARYLAHDWVENKTGGRVVAVFHDVEVEAAGDGLRRIKGDTAVDQVNAGGGGVRETHYP